MKKRIIAALLILLLAVGFAFAKEKEKKPIVVIYTNDVHCGYLDNNTYSGLAAVKTQYQAKYGKENVVLVDNGDAIQGAAIGTVSYGQYIVDLMNAVGYDFAVFGNHEFDYTLPRLAEVIQRSHAQYLACNIKYKGPVGSNKLWGSKPYKIVKFGDVKVAFIGVATPDSLTQSNPTYFTDSRGRYIYDFASGEDMYEVVQKYVDKVRRKGADYVIALTHLGLEAEASPNRSVDLIEHTNGIDVVLDGHSHSVVESVAFDNKDGRKVLYSQTGTKLQYIGVLTIDPENGTMKTELIQTKDRSAEIDKIVERIDSEYRAAMKNVVAHSQVELPIRSPEGYRIVRNREAAIGDLCADAFRMVSGADIGFMNGGCIRDALHKGDITLEQIIALNPFGNKLCMVETTGQQILDALEHGSKATQKDSHVGENAVGESGGFLHVSGLKYTIDTSIPSSVVTDSKGMFVKVDGPRRVKNVVVGSNEKGWTPIDPEKKYTLACHNYKLHSMGDGFTMFVNDKFLIDSALLDNQVLISYIRDFLNGQILESQYGKPQGRITVI